jgi:hypothetical protein
VLTSGFTEGLAGDSEFSVSTPRGSSSGELDSAEESIAFPPFYDSDDEDDDETDFEGDDHDTDLDADLDTVHPGPVPSSSQEVMLGLRPSPSIEGDASAQSNLGAAAQDRDDGALTIGKEEETATLGSSHTADEDQEGVRNVRQKLEHPSSPRSREVALHAQREHPARRVARDIPGPSKKRIVVRDVAYTTYKAVLYYVGHFLPDELWFSSELTPVYLDIHGYNHFCSFVVFIRRCAYDIVPKRRSAYSATPGHLATSSSCRSPIQFLAVLQSSGSRRGRRRGWERSWLRFRARRNADDAAQRIRQVGQYEQEGVDRRMDQEQPG